MQILIPDSTGLDDRAISMYAERLSRVSDVSAVSAPGGTYVNGALVGPPSAATGTQSGTTLLTVDSVAPLFSDRSDRQLDSLHAMARPAAGRSSSPARRRPTATASTRSLRGCPWCSD